MRRISLNLTDGHFGIWQDDPNDRSFRDDIYAGLIRFLRKRGWTIGQDPRIRRHYPSLNATHRRARKGPLLGTIEITGRVVKLQVWTESWTKDNPNGHQYDFGKLRRMLPIERRMVTVEHRAIIGWLRERCEIADITDRDAGKVGKGPGEITAMEWLRREWAEHWHNDKLLGRPKVDYRANGGANGRSADGHLIYQKQLVWFRDGKGRIWRGRAYYASNQTWHVVVNAYDVRGVFTSDIFVERPASIRRIVPARVRRSRLEQELQRAVKAMRYERAAVLRNVLFGGAEPVLIWSRKNSMFYGASCCGYASSPLDAGKYSLAEATREVQRVPHILEIRRLDGSRVAA